MKCPLLKMNICSARVRQCTPGKRLCETMLRAYIVGKYAQKETEYSEMQAHKTAEFAALVRWAKEEKTRQEAEASAAAQGKPEA